MNEAAKERLAEMKGDKSAMKVRKSSIAYKSSSLLPREPEIQELKIFVGMLYIFLKKI